METFDFLERIHQHDCHRAGSRCMKRVDKKGNPMCRVPKQSKREYPCFVEARDMYDAETLATFDLLGLRKFDNGQHVLDTNLVGGRWYYSAYSKDHNRLPTVPALAWSMLSCTNVQLCDRRFLLAYLLKYNAGQDEKSTVKLKPKHGTDIVTVDITGQQNTKITGQRYLAKKKEKGPLIREIGTTEIAFVRTGLDYVSVPARFRHYSTASPEHRMAVLKHPRNRIPRDTALGTWPVIANRRGLPSHRQFTSSQLIHIEDYTAGIHTADRTSTFSMRPPELLIVNALGDYITWFASSWTKNPPLPRDAHIESTPLWDGCGKIIKIRYAHLNDVATYIHKRLNEYSINPMSLSSQEYASALDLSNNILNRLVTERDMLLEPFNRLQENKFATRFINFSEDVPSIGVPSMISPRYAHPFLIHILLTEGRFQTEYDLYSKSNLKEAFMTAKILNRTDSVAEQFLRVFNKYVRTQLMWLPISTRKSSTLLTLAKQVLETFITTDEVIYDELPLMLMRQIQTQYKEETEKLIRDSHVTLVDTLVRSGIANCPGVDLLHNRVYVDWSPRLQHSSGQSKASWREQNAILDQGMLKILSLRRSDVNRVDGLILMGPPGCGKTFVMHRLEVFALTQQLHVMVSALTAQRAKELGGIHLHTLFKLPVGIACSNTPGFDAEKALLRLVHDTIATAFLRSLDVIFIDEVGMISMEMLATINIILRSIRKTSIPFGGILLIATGDFRQLAPVTGELVWVGTEMFTIFDIAAMQHLVRAMDDIGLQRLIQIDQITELNEDLIDEYIHIISHPDHGARFVNSWEDVPVEYVRIVSKKTAVREAVDDAMKIIQDQLTATNARNNREGIPEVEVIRFIATDEVETALGRWIPAEASATRSLNHHLREPQELLLFKGAKVRFTCNDFRGRYTQGQVGIVVSFNRTYTDGRIGVLLKIARPGAQTTSCTGQHVGSVELTPVWTSCTINARIGYLQARRKQVSLMPHGLVSLSYACVSELLIIVTVLHISL